MLIELNPTITVVRLQQALKSQGLQLRPVKERKAGAWHPADYEVVEVKGDVAITDYHSWVDEDKFSFED